MLIGMIRNVSLHSGGKGGGLSSACDTGGVRVSAAVDYAVRAAVVLAAAPAGAWVKGDVVAAGQGMSFRYSEQLLASLRKAGLVESQRGSDGGYRLSRPAAQIVVADVIRAIDGPLGEVRGLAPEDVEYPSPAEHVREVWVATRSALRAVLEHVTLADVASGSLPEVLTSLLADPAAWERRSVGGG
jgi:Rrf2 family protein